MKQWILARSQEGSTWSGLAVLLALVGLNADEAQAISHAGAAIAGAVAVFIKG